MVVSAFTRVRRILRPPHAALLRCLEALVVDWMLMTVLLRLEQQAHLFGSETAAPTAAAVGDVAQIFCRSEPVFKHMLKLLKNPNNSQLLVFLRKLRAELQKLSEGDTVCLPALVEDCEILIIVERVSERSFTFVVINTDPQSGLAYHAVSPSAKPGKIAYRTCMVLTPVAKKNALDDVFWMALYNLCITSRKGDVDKFYDVLLPFLTGKPLEASLVDAEQAASSGSASSKVS